MSALFGRVVEVQIGQPGAQPRVISSVTADGLPGVRLACTATRTTTRQDDTAQVAAWNLAPPTVSALQREGALCRVLAGYGVPTQIAFGRVLPKTIDGPRRSGGDWITRWSVTDGGLDLRDIVMSETWAGEVQASEVLDKVIASSGLGRGSIVLGSDVRWSSGYVVWSTVRQALAALAMATGSVIVVQDGNVQAWPVGGSRRSTVITLSSSSGMVESPQRQTDGTWSVRSLLLPSLRPGDTVNVDSRIVQGTMTVVDVRSDVDSVSGPFHSDITARPT